MIAFERMVLVSARRIRPMLRSARSTNLQQRVPEWGTVESEAVGV